MGGKPVSADNRRAQLVARRHDSFSIWPPASLPLSGKSYSAVSYRRVISAIIPLSNRNRASWACEATDVH